jgi:hypothetical protein
MHERRVGSLSTVTLEEALAYLDYAEGDELKAAEELAQDRNLLDGCDSSPDHAEVHHALFLLRKARGLSPPSYDTTSSQLRKKAA